MRSMRRGRREVPPGPGAGVAGCRGADLRPAGPRADRRAGVTLRYGPPMNWTLEVVCVPVTDVERAKAFYAEQLGFAVDHDTTIGPGNRMVQLTPPGSGCSVVIGDAIVDMAPGSLKGLQLVVNDVRAARAELAGRGVEVGEVQFLSPGGARPAQDDDDLNNSGFLFFTDPDGNAWAVQQITDRP